MDPEILKCQTYLHPDKPVEVTSTDVKQYLTELGWKEGDKIPSGMPEYTSHVLKAMGKPVTVKSLEAMFANETVQATLKSALNKVKLYNNSEAQVAERVKEIIPNPEDIHEGAREELMQLAKNKAKADIEKEAAKMNVGEVEEFAGLEDVGSDDQSDASPAEDQELESSHNEVPTPAEALANSHICPRCGFDTTKEYVPYPVTEEDKIKYAYSILGGTDFTKTYKVAEGLLEITYKVPTTYVNRLIEDQLKYDSNSKKIVNYDQSYINSIRYGLAASLDNVKSNFGVDNNVPVPDMFSEEFATQKETPLPLFTKYVEDKIIKSGTREALFRSTYSDFLRLQVRLQYDLKSENFIKAVLDKS